MRIIYESNSIASTNIKIKKANFPMFGFCPFKTQVIDVANDKVEIGFNK